MIRVEGLRYAVGDFGLRGIDLEIPSGEYFVLLGPPGSGKTVLMECLCGLARVQSGRIRIGDRDVTNLEPRERGIGYVPQDYALFPHRSVAWNIEFGLRASGLTRKDRERRTLEMAGWLDIPHLLSRGIAGLSGGEKQRVALARALAIRPEVLLLDEPVNALDERMRESVCLELKRLQRETKTTAIHVCHDFEEARLVADRIGVMRGGELVQAGAPEELFTAPRDAQLAWFLRVGSVLSGVAEGGCIRIDGGEVCAKNAAEGAVELTIRADEIIVTDETPEPPADNVLEGTVVLVSPRGPFTRVDVEIAPGTRLQANLPRTIPAPAMGARVWVSFPASAVHVFGA